MGIPRFYRFITERFPKASQSISFKNGFNRGYDTPIDNLYLDANGIIHDCARAIYFEKNPRLSYVGRKPPPPPSNKELEIQVFQAIGGYMNQLLQFVKPRNVFYIAIDGPAPLAKQSQQRQRRYKSADERDPDEFKKFDTTAITPGTEFMQRLSNYIKYYTREKMSTDSQWASINVIFSGPETPGEGEHKIVNYIRDLPDKWKLSHCMYGLDADLFMLSLSTHCRQFYLLREDQFRVKWGDTLFYKVNIGKLRKDIFEMWGEPDSNQNRLIDDFIFICFLVGNDFLHALPGCHELQTAIAELMDLRKAVLKDNFITNRMGYNIPNLLYFLQELAKTEREDISHLFYQTNFPNITLNNSLIDPGDPKMGIDLDKYRTHYYKKIGIDVDDQNEIWDFCKQYLQGLEWVHCYYHNQPTNWLWYFPFHYTPLVTDLVAFLSTNDKTVRLSRVSNIPGQPISPFQQLICVVPPKSQTLLPKFLRKVYSGPMKKYYPKKYHLDLEGKMMEWEAIAILPFIDPVEMFEEYEQLLKKGKKAGLKTDFIRNRFSDTQVFKVGEKSVRYKSEYGVIENCHIVATSL